MDWIYDSGFAKILSKTLQCKCPNYLCKNFPMRNTIVYRVFWLEPIDESDPGQGYKLTKLGGQPKDFKNKGEAMDFIAQYGDGNCTILEFYMP
jgi:hypothetical protein